MTTIEIMYLGLGVFGTIMVGCATIAFRKWWKRRAARKGKEVMNAVEVRLDRMSALRAGGVVNVRTRVEELEQKFECALENSSKSLRLSGRVDDLELWQAGNDGAKANLEGRVEQLSDRLDSHSTRISENTGRIFKVEEGLADAKARGQKAQVHVNERIEKLMNLVNEITKVAGTTFVRIDELEKGLDQAMRNLESRIDHQATQITIALQRLDEARDRGQKARLVPRVEALERQITGALVNATRLNLSGRVEDLEREVSCLENPPKPESRVARHWVGVTAERPSKPVPAKKKKRKAARSTGS